MDPITQFWGNAMRIVGKILVITLKVVFGLFIGLVVAGWLYERRMANDPGAKWYREWSDRNAAENAARRANTAR
jgi:hypothetical protein